ncbi:MAG: ATP synthase F1 subunit epsilon [Deltaproteobacteria bacterium]|jgi:F-type H+-transporting ATPase subunit epsilon|nr:ATP synthase F1 subunit epsilon [Deltaproteobacteria bacterium]
MSDKTFTFTLVTPERRLVEPIPVGSVNAFGKEGAFTALPGHTPFLTPLKDGTVVKTTAPGGDETSYYVDAGIIEVLPDRVSVLAEAAVNAAELDREREARKLQEQQRLLEEARKLPPGPKKLLEVGELEVQIMRASQRLKHLDRKKNV